MKNVQAIKEEIYNRAKDSGYDVDMERYTQAVDWLFAPENKKMVVQCLLVEHQIDYPNYFEMPRSLSNELSGDEVDLLQEFVPTTLKNYYTDELTNIKKPKMK